MFSAAALTVAAATAAVTPAYAERVWVPVPLAKSEALSPSPSTADSDRGRTLFGQCRACHAVGDATDHGIGPRLDGIVGRRAADQFDYAYSQDMTKAGQEGLVWTRDFLSAYLLRPAEFLPETKMAFSGIPDAEDRADIIAFLATFERGPEPPGDRVSGEDRSGTATEPARNDAPVRSE